MLNQNANAQMMSNQQVQANNASTFGANNSLQQTGINIFANSRNLFEHSRASQNSYNIFNQPGSWQDQPAQNQGSLSSSVPPTPSINNNNLSQPTSLFGNS